MPCRLTVGKSILERQTGRREWKWYGGTGIDGGGGWYGLRIESNGGILY
jgi:hypothetical protein